jgi:hypothetical protein
MSDAVSGDELDEKANSRPSSRGTAAVAPQASRALCGLCPRGQASHSGWPWHRARTSH